VADLARDCRVRIVGVESSRFKWKEEKRRKKITQRPGESQSRAEEEKKELENDRDVGSTSNWK
jgi:hypothetical protein